MLSNIEEFEDALKRTSLQNNLKPNVTSLIQGDFFMRYTTIQSWFMRCSFASKFKFLAQMYKIIKRNEEMPIWYDSIQKNSIDKLMAYADTLKYHQFHYDKILLDSNRTCNDQELDKTMKNDLEWIQQLDEDFQEGLFLALLGMGGGGIIRHLCSYMKIYSNPHEHTINQPTKNLTERKDSNEGLNAAINSKMYVEPLNPVISADQILLNKQKEWDKMIAKYTKAVTGKVQGAGKNKKGKSEKSSKKSNKNGKSVKSSIKKASKTSKSKDGEILLDYLQQLPIKIVKKILGYLDTKTLKRAKTVNPYWEYAIDSLFKDIKARKGLDKAVMQLEKTVPPDAHPIKRVCKPEYCKPLSLREGTTSKTIHKKMDSQGLNHEETLITKAIQEMAEQYTIPLTINLKSFPRKLTPENDEDIYKGQPCIIYEGGVMEKIISDIEPMSSDINIQTKMGTIKVDSPLISSTDLHGGLFAPSKENILENEYD